MLDLYVNGGKSRNPSRNLHWITQRTEKLRFAINGFPITKVANTANGMATRSSLLTGKMMARNLKISDLDRSSVTLRPIFGRLFRGQGLVQALLLFDISTKVISMLILRRAFSERLIQNFMR